MNKKEWVVVLIITFIVIMIWIGLSIVKTKSSVPLNPELQSILEPVVPVFDNNVLKQIEEKMGSKPQVSPSKLQPTPQSSPTVSPSPSASPSASPSVTPASSPTSTPRPTVTPSPTPSATASPTPSPSITATPTASPTT